MRTPTIPLVVPRDAAVYSADGVKLGHVSGVGLQSLRLHRGRFLTPVFDVPVQFIARVERGDVWLDRDVKVTLDAARPVASPDVPYASMTAQPLEGADGANGADRADATRNATPAFQIPLHAPVYERNGTRFGAVVDATPVVLVVRTGPFPWSGGVPLPLAAIDRVEGGKVSLNVSAEDAKRIGAGAIAPSPAAHDRRNMRYEGGTRKIID